MTASASTRTLWAEFSIRHQPKETTHSSTGMLLELRYYGIFSTEFSTAFVLTTLVCLLETLKPSANYCTNDCLGAPDSEAPVGPRVKL